MTMNPDPSTLRLGLSAGAHRSDDGIPLAAARPDPKVVAMARRRQFSMGEKRVLLAEVERCKAAATFQCVNS